MDRKSIVVLVVCFLGLLLWIPLTQKIYPPLPAPMATNRMASATNRVAEVARDSNAVPAQASIQMPSAPTASWLKPGEPEQLLVITNDSNVYTFTSHGGGIKTIELRGHQETVGVGTKKSGSTNRFIVLNLNATVPALAVFGAEALQDGAPYALSRVGDGVRAEKLFSNGVYLTKTFLPSSNHTLRTSVKLANRGPQPIRLGEYEVVVGTSTPMNRKDPGDQFLGVQWYDGKSATFVNEPWFANKTLGCFPGTPRTEYRSPGVSNVVWAAAHNQFFTMIGAPQDPAPQLAVRRVDLPGPSAAEKAADPKVVDRPFGHIAAWVYPSQTLPPGTEIQHDLELFAGPKEYYTLAKLGKNQDLAMNFSSFFGWFAKALLLSMNGLHKMGLSYALAIIAITFVIKLLFWPLTQASTRSMKRMQLLQPQMKALQEKYKDDPKKMNQKLMEFMKENRVSPLGGCLPILLQIPVFIGFYQMLQSAIELRGATFLWASDLSQPDTVAVIFGLPINPLPLLMGATQFWMAKLTPPSPGVDPVQQKMMQYMPLMFIFILYSFPAGLALYWTVQNLLSILQMKLTKPGSLQPANPGAGKAALPPMKKK